MKGTKLKCRQISDTLWLSAGTIADRVITHYVYIVPHISVSLYMIRPFNRGQQHCNMIKSGGRSELRPLKGEARKKGWLMKKFPPLLS
jgi:hypothetical protein